MPSPVIYTLSLHDALPIYAALRGAAGELAERQERLARERQGRVELRAAAVGEQERAAARGTPLGDPIRIRDRQNGAGRPISMRDRKSTRLNSSHRTISYAVPRHLHSFPTRRSSDLCGSARRRRRARRAPGTARARKAGPGRAARRGRWRAGTRRRPRHAAWRSDPDTRSPEWRRATDLHARSEEHTSELQSPYDLVCRPPSSTLFPYTTLFRSMRLCAAPPASSPSARNGSRAKGRAGSSCAPRPLASRNAPPPAARRLAIRSGYAIARMAPGDRSPCEIGRAHV